MQQLNRRRFLRHTTLLTTGAAFLPSMLRGAPPVLSGKKPFKMCLNPFSIGVSVDQQELLQLATQYGFEAMVAIPQQLADMEPGVLKDLVADMEQQGVSWGAAGLPVQFRESEQKFREDLNALPRLADALQRAGVTRTNTWIMPTHAERTYRKNFELHRSRLQQVANVLGHYDVKLGLEYVGPKTLMARDRYAFIRTMEETKELLDAIGEPNVGFVLDSFHWYCAGESAADILTLDAADIVTCDLNDARAGIPADQQIDGKRELPTATGVIDLKSFLSALVQIGYDGPVRAEPFNAPLNEMDNEAAVKATLAAMKKSFELVG